MASWSRREVVTKQIEYMVPVWADHGSAIGEVLKAYAAASFEAASLGISTDSDDWARVIAGDEHVIIRFKAKEEA